MSTYDLTSSIPSSSVLKTGDILNCPYSGSSKTITLPKGKYRLECWGAQGGYRSSSSYGGKGGYAKGTLTLTANTVIILVAGGSGNTGGTSGGFNGGGKRSSYAGGGGGSDVRIKNDNYLSRVIVAGGGGSDGASNKPGGYGGGTSGKSATENYGSYGQGGTQTGNGSGSTSSSPSDNSNYGGFGFGGYGSNRSSGYGGAGGGGWYGGCGARPDGSGDDDRGGGGGSGYIYTSGTASNYPSGCTLNSAYYLTDTSLVNGGTSFTDYDGSTVTGHSGNGAVRITCLEVNNVAPPTNLKATVDGGNVTLTWNASTTSGISGYDVTLVREGTTIRTVRVTSTSYKSAFVAGKWTVQVKTVKGDIHSAAVSTTFTVVAPDPPSDLTYTLDRGVVTLNWVASGSENVTGYVVTYKKGSTVASTSSVTGTTDSYRITPGSWTVSVVTNQNGLYSGEVTVSFTIQAISNPSNLQGSIGDGGIGSITWTGTTDSNVLGYSIYMLSPMRVLVGYSPYGKPLFKFAFENNSLTDKLIEMSTFLQDTFLYQLEPRKQYTFAVVSSNKEYENIPEDGPKIHMYYSTSVSFKSFSLKPNPVYTKESLIISAEVTEKIDSTITTS